MGRHVSFWLAGIFLIVAISDARAAQAPPAAEEIKLIVGQSTVIKAPWPTRRVAVTDPNTAYVQALTPDQVLVQGFTVGVTDLILWTEDEQSTWQRRVVVRPDVSAIRSTVRGLFPTAVLDVNDSGQTLVVRGAVRSSDQGEQLEKYLKAIALKTKTPYVNLTTLSGGGPVHLDIHNIRTTLRGMFPTTTLDVNDCGGMLVVRGRLSNADQARHLKRYLDQIAQVTEDTDGKKTEKPVPYVDMTTLEGAQTRYLDMATIRRTLQGLFPTAVLDVNESGGVLFVRGTLRSAEQAQQLKEYLGLLRRYKEETTTTKESPLVPNLTTKESKTVREVGEPIPHVNMTTVSGVQQVQLQVRVAEVSRAAIKSLGINAFHMDKSFFLGQRVGSSNGGALVPSINIGAAEGQTAQNLQFVTPEDGIGASPLVTIFAGFPRANLEVFFQALAENQYMRILANPTLVAMSGEEATFLAGGEFPIPVVQGAVAGGTNAITIQYKEFGVRLIFRPVVLGEGGIRLRAMQEVSELSDVGALVIQGFSIPALATRRAEATLELKSGQSFAMAGLLQHNDSAITSRIPGLGDLPVLGPLFRSVRYRNNESELVILVTAALVEPMSVATAPPLPGATYAPPNDWELYLEGRIEGQGPARLDPASAAWLREMGLDQLAGPGAWDSYEGQSITPAPAVGAADSQPKPKETL